MLRGHSVWQLLSDLILHILWLPFELHFGLSRLFLLHHLGCFSFDWLAISNLHLQDHIDLVILGLEQVEFVLQLCLGLHDGHDLLLLHVDLVRNLVHLLILSWVDLNSLLLGFLDHLLVLLIHLL